MNEFVFEIKQIAYELQWIKENSSLNSELLSFSNFRNFLDKSFSF